MRAQLQIVETPLAANWHKQRIKRHQACFFVVVVDAGSRIEAGKDHRM